MRGWRWAVVAGGIAMLASLPAVVAALPTAGSRLSAADLLARVKAAGAAAYSGYVQSSGGLALPVTDQLSSLTDLLGGQTTMRVWWRSATDWRVDTETLTGESDVHQQGDQIWRWDYESNTASLATVPTDGSVRLPIAADLVPASLGRRVLSQAAPAEVSRLPVRRVAGRSVPGLRLHQASPRTTIDHVDVWVDPGTGLPLRVVVAGAGTTVLTTQFLDFSTNRPPATDTTFIPPTASSTYSGDPLDVSGVVDDLIPAALPDQLAGADRNPPLPPFDRLGVYGRGVGEFVVGMLPPWSADRLRDQLGDSGFSVTAQGQEVAIGPLSLLLTPDRADGTAWLLAGTVTVPTLTTAAAQLRNVPS